MKRATILACALLLACGGAVRAQDSVTVVAGEQYRAGGLKRFVFGNGYRDAWTTPVRVPVLDLARFGGGLTPTEEGGGRATESLRFQGADGHQYVFRSVDKVARRAFPEDLQHSVVERIAQDLTSAKHPAAALSLPPVMRAMGVLHVSPTLYVMPDDARLGQFREEWRGRYGQVEERLEDDLAAVIFPGADDMESTEDFLEKLEEDPRNRVDALGYLTARLVDLWVGDWDRHFDQWRWVRFDGDGLRTWRPVPRDRDNAFVRYEGLVMTVARSKKSNLVRFGPEIGDVYAMHYQSSETDRKILPWVERAQWDSVTQWVRARLTDELIAQAMGRFPPEYRRLDAERIATALRARRERLPAASAELYQLVAREAELHASDAGEQATVTRRADGGVEVAFQAEGLPRQTRTFLPGETKEVRVFMHGGDDRVTLDGPARDDIVVRVIGGGGDDVLAERAAGGGVASTRFYDDRGDNQITPGRGRVDTHDWETPVFTPVGGNPRAPRDYGGTSALLSPWGRWQANVGPVIGVGPSGKTFAFRRVPFSTSWLLSAVYAPLVPHGYGAELWVVQHRTGRPAHLTLALRANRFETWRFHGYGNDSPTDRDYGDYAVRHDFAGAELLLNDSLGGGWTMAVGPTAAWRQAQRPAAGDVLGAESHLLGGMKLRLNFDQRDTLPVTRRSVGWTAEVNGLAWSDGAPFARMSTSARMSFPLIAGGPALALRAGGEHALGDFPFQDAAMIGGGMRVRGYDEGRFLGDAASWGSAELRQPLGTVRLLVRGRLGVLALGDAGRVWLDGESVGDWHTALGGGLWFETLGKVGSITVAHGEVTRAYFAMGMPF